MLKAFDQNKGYVAFMDAGAFLDGMLKFGEATRKDLVRRKGTTKVDQEVEEVMVESLRNFFLGMHEKDTLKGVSGAAQRNPFISFGHMMPGMSIFRFDFFKETDEFFQMFKENKFDTYTEDYLDFLRNKRSTLKNEKATRILQDSGVVHEKSTAEDYLNYYKRQKDMYRGAIKIGDDGKPVMETVTSGGKTYQRPVREGGTISDMYAQKANMFAEAGLDFEDYENLKAKRESLKAQKQALGVMPKPMFDKEGNIVKDDKGRIVHSNQAELDQMNKRKFDAIYDEYKASQGVEDLEATRRGLAGRGSGGLHIEGIHGRVFYDIAGDISEQDRATLPKQIQNVERQIADAYDTKSELKRLDRQLANATDPEEQDRIAKRIEKVENKNKTNIFEIDERINSLSLKKQSLIGRSQMTDEMFTRSQSITLLTEMYKRPGVFFTNKDAHDNFIKEINDFYNLGATDTKTLEGKEVRQVMTQLVDSRGGKEGTRVDKLFKVLGSLGIDVSSYEEAKAQEATARETMMQKQDLLHKDRQARVEKRKKINEALEENRRLMQPFQEVIENQKIVQEAIIDPEVRAAEKIEADFKIFKEQLGMAREAVGDEGLDFKSLDRQFGNQFPGARLTSEALDSSFQRVQSFAGQSIENFEQFKGVVERIEALGEGDQKAGLQKDVNLLFRRLLKKHETYGKVGGGAVYFPEVNIKSDLVDEFGKKIGGYEGRMDFTRFAIGDYDADIYQVFFDTDKKMRNAILEGDRHKGLIEYGSKFLVSMSELGKGMKNLGTRMEAVSGAQNLLESRLDNATKERFVKAVGNLDVYVKTGMLGLAQAAASDASGDMGKSFGRMSTGAALVSVAQEVLAIKAKKLPVAAGISDQFVAALKTSFETGSGERLKEFFKTKVLPGTAFADSKSIMMQNIDFTDLPTGAGLKTYESALTGMKINMDELFEGLDVMSRTVHKTGIGNIASNTRLSRMLAGSGPVSYEQMARLLNMGETMEGGAIMGKETMAAVQDIFDSIDRGASGIGNIIPKRGIAGLAAGGLVGAYAIGATSGIQSFEGTERFSDMRVKQRNTDPGLMKAMGHQHRDVPATRSMNPENFYQRPINQQQTVVSSGMSTRLYGEAPTLNAAQNISRQMTLSGGRSSITINDNRRPIGYSYINKMIRD